MPKSQYAIHKACSMLPMMTPEEYEELVKSIKLNGLKEPIELFKGEVLIGRHRYRACEELGIAFDTITLPDDIDPYRYVAIKDLCRRNVSVSQKAMVLAELEKHFISPGEIKSKGRGRPKKPETDEARTLGVGKTTMSQARSVAEHGDEETKQDVKDGKVSVKQAAAKTREQKAYEKCELHVRRSLAPLKLSGTQWITLSKKSPEEQTQIASDLRKGLKTLDEVFTSKKRKTAESSPTRTRATPTPEPSRVDQFKAIWDKCTQDERRDIANYVQLQFHQKQGRKRGDFTPPSIDEVREYCRQRKNGIDAAAFMDHYISVGWVIGKNGKGTPMKDWKGSVRTWENRRKKEGKADPSTFEV